MIEVIPAIDVIEGKCVRLERGDFSKATEYSDDPVETAKKFESVGICRLHMVDLDGARTGKLTNLRVLESIATGTDLTIDYGGGITSREDLHNVFDAGAAIANVGSVAVRSPERFFEWVDEFGDSILLGVDVRNRSVAIDGWQSVTKISPVPFLAKYQARGVRQAFVTDVSKDGVLAGPAWDLYREVRKAAPELRLIASGGVRSMDDVKKLEEIGCIGVIIGKAIYEQRITMEELATYVS